MFLAKRYRRPPAHAKELQPAPGPLPGRLGWPGRQAFVHKILVVHESGFEQAATRLPCPRSVRQLLADLGERVHDRPGLLEVFLGMRPLLVGSGQGVFRLLLLDLQLFLFVLELFISLATHAVLMAEPMAMSIKSAAPATTTAACRATTRGSLDQVGPAGRNRPIFQEVAAGRPPAPGPWRSDRQVPWRRP